MTGLVAIIAFSAAAASQNPQEPGSEPTPLEDAPAEDIAEVIQAKTDRETRLTVPVNVEGQGPFRFLIDTGSERSVISSALASSLNLREGPSARIAGVAGSEDVRTVHVDHVELGRRSLKSMVLPLLERRHIGADGIVGNDGLKNQRVLLDFGNNRIEIGDADSLGGNSGYEIVVRAKQRSGQLIMTNARLDGIRVSVILDTGGGTTVGNGALQRALGRRGHSVTPVTLRSATGQTVTADIGSARKLDIRGVSISNLVIAFADSPAFARLKLDRRPALFLGMRELRLFKRVAIDFRKRSLLFDIPAQQ
ncbi:MAG: retroviral-like aspartic protease family protein [Sphingomonadaceae bacterium]|nr:retroviral-like aspartic protease family protein [Sphingomonadaceae bacterium]